jgi:conjugal transfer pilus assembly protein TraV
MVRPVRFLICACLAVFVSGCATFGTNVEGNFTCRAPKGDCAPSHVIDARAAAVSGDGTAPQDLARIRVGVGGGDTARTAERTLRIVFPAHVDEAGTLHDEAVAWTVIENPRWAAELRRKPGEDTAPPLMRQLRRQLKSAQQIAEKESKETIPDADAPQDDMAALEGADPSPQASPVALAAPQDPDSLPSSPDASPLALPSTAREALAGAKAPAAGGGAMPAAPHDRTPWSLAAPASPKFPSIEAIEAAIAKRAAGKTITPAAPNKDQK